MSGCKLRVFRATRNGTLKLNGYATNEFPKEFRSWESKLPEHHIEALGIEGSFIIALVNSVYSGAFFTRDSTIAKYNIWGLLIEHLSNETLEWIDLAVSSRDSFTSEQIRIIKSFTEKHFKILQKFIRKN